MNLIDYILIAVIALLFIAAVRSSVKKKGCCGDCSKCCKNCKK